MKKMSVLRPTTANPSIRKKGLQSPIRIFPLHPYPQVFENKYGFIPNLSIIDLLFNEGGHAVDIPRMSAQA